MSTLWVNGIVSVKDKQPYIQLSNENGIFSQLTMAQARNVAMDILQMCARTEADAMIHKYFEEVGHPEISGQIMLGFREFRAKLDDEAVERERSNPEEGK